MLGPMTLGALRSGGASFNPSSVLDVWLEDSFLNSLSPDVAATDGQTVTRYEDEVGTRHGNQTTEANKPVYDADAFRGRGGVQLVDTGDGLVISWGSAINTENIVLLFALENVATAGATVLVSNQHHMRVTVEPTNDGDGLVIRRGDGNSANVDQVNARAQMHDGVSTTYALRFAGTTLEVFRNGVEDASSPYTLTQNYWSNIATSISVGFGVLGYLRGFGAKVGTVTDDEWASLRTYQPHDHWFESAWHEGVTTADINQSIFFQDTVPDYGTGTVTDPDTGGPNAGSLTVDRLASIDASDLGRGAGPPDKTIPDPWIIYPRLASVSDSSDVLIMGPGHGALNTHASNSEKIAQAAIRCGLPVLFVSLPGDTTTTTHDNYTNNGTNQNDLDLFVMGVQRAMNSWEAEHPTWAGRYVACGFSGSGMNMLLNACLDPTRIRHVAPIEGFDPYRLATGARDWEQQLPGIADIPASWMDLIRFLDEGESSLDSIYNDESPTFPETAYNLEKRDGMAWLDYLATERGLDCAVDFVAGAAHEVNDANVAAAFGALYQPLSALDEIVTTQDAGYSEPSGTWNNVAAAYAYYSGTGRYSSSVGAQAQWQTSTLAAGTYRVYIVFASAASNRDTAAEYRVNGDLRVTYDQRYYPTASDGDIFGPWRWIDLGAEVLAESGTITVTVTRGNNQLTADAIAVRAI